MRFTKVLGLAAVAAVAAMAFIGTSSALAVDQIVLCSQLVTGATLCPAGKLLPKETKLLALAANPELVTSSGAVKCEDSTVEVLTLAEIGATLPVDVNNLAFGTLPTPTLGTGCSVCTGGIHTNPSYKGTIEVSGADEFFLKTEGSALLLNCFGFLTCEYGATNLKFKIDRDATLHPKLSAAKGDLLLTGGAVLTRGAGGSGFCPEKGIWNASYTSIGCHNPVTKTLVDCWVALDNP